MFYFVLVLLVVAVIGRVPCLATSPENKYAGGSENPTNAPNGGSFDHGSCAAGDATCAFKLPWRTFVNHSFIEYEGWIDSQRFYTAHMKGRKAAVFRGATKDWKATQMWRNTSFLASERGEEVFRVETRKHQADEPAAKIFMKLKNFLASYQKELYYLDSKIDSLESNLTKDLGVPDVLRCPELASTIDRPHILFSSGNTSSYLHQDGYENLLCLISGTKTVYVIDSRYSEYMYANEYTLFPGLSPVFPMDFDPKRFPKFLDAPVAKITLHAGDVLYIPQYWWHFVVSSDSPNIAATIWFSVFDHSLEAWKGGIKDRHVVENSLLFDRLFKTEMPDVLPCRGKVNASSLTILIKKFFDEGTEAKALNESSSYILPPFKLNSGHLMPRLGFGTAGLYEKTESAVQHALASGYTMFDSAQMEGYSERLLGQALANAQTNRSELFIITKIDPLNYGYEKTKASFRASLLALQTPYVDLLLIHTRECDDSGTLCSSEVLQSTWRAMSELKREGLVRSLGVSNFDTAEELEEFSRSLEEPIDVVQNWFDAFHQDVEIRAWCRKRGIAYIGYSPLGGVWEREAQFNPILNSIHFREVALPLDLSVAQLMVRYALQSNVAVIPRSSAPLHIRNNARVQWFHLPETKMLYLSFFDGMLDLERDALNRLKRCSSKPLSCTKILPTKPEMAAIFTPEDYRLRMRDEDENACLTRACDRFWTPCEALPRCKYCEELCAEDQDDDSIYFLCSLECTKNDDVEVKTAMKNLLQCAKFCFDL